MSELIHIIGSAACWREDYERALNTYGAGDVCVLNYMGAVFDLGPGPDICFSLHYEVLELFKKEIERAKRLMPLEFWTVLPMAQDPKRWAGWHRYFRDVPRSGSTSLAAAHLMSWRYDLAVLSGCPMRQIGYAEGYYHGKEFVADSKGARYVNVIAQWLDCWRRNAPNFKGEVRSMSGATKEILDAR